MINVISYVSPVNLSALLPHSYKVTHVQFFTQRVFLVCCSLPATKRGVIRYHFFGTPYVVSQSSFFKVAPISGSKRWPLCIVVTPGTIVGEVVGMSPFKITNKTEQGISGPCHGLILSWASSHPAGSCVLHDDCSPLSLRVTLLFESASNPMIFIWWKWFSFKC